MLRNRHNHHKDLFHVMKGLLHFSKVVSNLSFNMLKKKLVFTAFNTTVFPSNHSRHFISLLQHTEPPRSLIHARQKTSQTLTLVNYWCVFGWINNSVQLLHHNLSLSIYLFAFLCASLHRATVSSIQLFHLLAMHVDFTPSPISTQQNLHNLFYIHIHAISQ